MHVHLPAYSIRHSIIPPNPPHADTNEDRLRQVFGEFGPVTDIFLPSDRNTGRPRGFGFVTMGTRPAAESAIAKMDQSQLDGRTVRVNESKPRGEGPADRERGFGPGGMGGFNSSGRPEVKLYVGNLSFDTPEETVRKLFEDQGQVVDCFLPTDRDTGRVRGFAFVTMVSADAEKACRNLNGYELDGRPLRVNEAQPKGMGGGPRGGGGGFGGGGYGGRGGYDDRGYGGKLLMLGSLNLCHEMSLKLLFSVISLTSFFPIFGSMNRLSLLQVEEAAGTGATTITAMAVAVVSRLTFVLFVFDLISTRPACSTSPRSPNSII